MTKKSQCNYTLTTNQAFADDEMLRNANKKPTACELCAIRYLTSRWKTDSKSVTKEIMSEPQVNRSMRSGGWGWGPWE